MSSESEGYISFGVGILLGMGIGAAIGVLLAPKSGEEFRSDIKELADKIPENFNENIEKTRGKASSFVDKTKYNIEKKFNSIDESFKAGKMAAAKKKEDLEEDYGI